MNELLKLLGLVRRELGAVDVRAEVGGQPPEDPHLVWVPLEGGFRVVAVLARPPADRRALIERLQALVAPFPDVIDSVTPPPTSMAIAQQLELDQELANLAQRATGLCAVVVDERSPMVWGTSRGSMEGWDIHAMEDLVGLKRSLGQHQLSAEEWLSPGPEEVPEDIDETQIQRWLHRAQRLAALAPTWTGQDWQTALKTAEAVLMARAACSGGRAPDRFAKHRSEIGVFAKGFAQIYMVVIAFEGPYSELHAEGPLVRHLPVIERLVLALPPVEPPPRRAKVIQFRPV